jgi:hypothetical protein
MIDQADAAIRSTWPAYTKYIHADTFTCKATFNPVGAGASTQVDVNVDGDVATSQPIPSSQVFRIDDIYTNSAGDTPIQALVQFYKNKIKLMATTANIAVQVVSNQTRPGLPAVFIYEPQSSMQLYASNIAAVTATDTDTFRLNWEGLCPPLLFLFFLPPSE